jgi:predicted RNA-binding protein with PIN domain
MKIDGIEIPKYVITSWLTQIQHLQSDSLRLLAAGRPSLTQGFRPNSFKVEIVRDRLKSVLNTSNELPIDIRDQLRNNGLATSLLIVFSEKALQEIAEPIADFFGYVETVAALLLDDRQPVRAIGLFLIDKRKGSEPNQTKEEAAVSIVAAVRPFLTHIQLLLQYQDQIASSTTPETAQATSSNATGVATALPRAPRPRREAELVTVLRKKRQEANRLNKENSVLSSRLNATTTEATSTLISLTETSNKLASTLKELNGLRTQFDLKVDDAVGKRLDSKLFPWLEPAEAIEQASYSLGISAYQKDLATNVVEGSIESEQIRLAEALLVRQKESDRRYGLRSALQAEGERCASLLESLREAQRDSFRPLPELADGIKALEGRISQINQALGINPSGQVRASANLLAIETAIVKADSLEKLSALRQQLIASEPLGLLNDEELDQAYYLLGQATSIAYARVGLGRGWSMGKEDLVDLPLYALQASLSQDEQCVLVVDGHNVLWKVPTLFRNEFENGQPGAKARKVLEKALLALSKRYPSLSVELWFDSNDAEDRTITENFRVHFSGGRGANRADLQILAYLSHMKISGGGQVRAVATADMDIATTAKESGAFLITPHELAIWMA